MSALLALTSLSGWDIDVQLAGAQICVVSGSTDRNGRLWIMNSMNLKSFESFSVIQNIHSNSCQKMWPLQVRCLGSGFKHRPPVWDVAMSMLWMKRLSPWPWTIFSNLAKNQEPQGNHGHGRWLNCLSTKASKEGCWKESEICASSFPETRLKKVEFCASIRSAGHGFFIKQSRFRSPMKADWLEGKPGKAHWSCVVTIVIS